MNLSVVINTRNEEKNLPQAIASVRQLADEIVVVDMESEDKTCEVAKRNSAKVYKYKNVGYVEPARNFAIGKATNDWIFILDADEEVSSGLAKTIKSIIKDENSADFYRIARKNIIFSKFIKHSRWWPDYNIRLFKRGMVTWSEIIHSVPETHGDGVDLEAVEDNAIIHHHYISVEQFIERMNRYTGEHAKLKIKEGYRFRWHDLIKKPTEEFLSRFFAGEGYKDGVHGLALAFLQSFSELVLYLKIWQAERFAQESLSVADVVSEMKKTEGDLHYWQADVLVKEGGGFIQKVKRKLRL